MQAAREKLELLIRIIGDLASIDSETELIKEIISSSISFSGSERGFMIIRRNGKSVYYDHNGEEVQDPEISQSTIDRVILEQKPLCLIEDNEGHSIPPTASIMALDLKTLMCAPLNLRLQEDDQPVRAVLYVDSRIVTRAFNRQDLDFFTLLARHAGVVWRHLKLSQRLRQDYLLLQEEVRSKYDYHRIVGQCEQMQEVYKTLEMLKETDVDVLIEGETGTGKELIAKAIHYASNRSEHPLKELNCAALPEDLVEAELFGVEKNVATGVTRRIGKLEQADQGTLFLDEIGDMELRIQNRLLRFLEERRFRRIGGREEIKAEVRVLAATNKNLVEEVKKGTFRDALRYRLDVVRIHLPPLKERGDDLELLANFFLKEVVEKYQMSVEGFTAEAWELMKKYSWPGNIRELKHRVQSAAFLAEGKLIDAADLAVKPGKSPEDFVSLSRVKTEHERNLVKKTLERYEWDLNAAARVLRTTVSSLNNKITTHNLTKDPQ